MTIPGNEEEYLNILKKSAYPRVRDVKVKTKKENVKVSKKDGKVKIDVDASDEANMAYTETANDLQPIAVVKNDQPATKYLNKKTIKPTKIKIRISADDKTPDPDNTVH